MMEAYYYARLSKDKQQAYYAIWQGLLSMAPSFSVPKYRLNELLELFTFVQLDHPEIFYASSFSVRSYAVADSVEFLPVYLFKKKMIQEHQKAIDARVRKLARAAMELDEEGKEKYVHDLICETVRYDKLKKAYSHEVIGPLTQGVGVCEGIAKSVKILLDALHIPCIIVFSHNNPEKGVKYRHAWNLVKIKGKWYHLDATFDNSLTKNSGDEKTREIRYDYFNLGDKAMFRDHEPVVWTVPDCTEEKNTYYLTHKQTFTKMEELRKRCAQAIKKKKQLIFQWRGSFLTREVLQEICVMLEEETEGKNKVAKLSVNWPQAIMKVWFEEEEAEADSVENTEGKAEVQVQMEEANEGELYNEEGADTPDRSGGTEENGM